MPLEYSLKVIHRSKSPANDNVTRPLLVSLATLLLVTVIRVIKYYISEIEIVHTANIGKKNRHFKY